MGLGLGLGLRLVEDLVAHVPLVAVVLLEEASEQRQTREAAHQRDELAEIEGAWLGLTLGLGLRVGVG